MPGTPAMLGPPTQSPGPPSAGPPSMPPPGGPSGPVNDPSIYRGADAAMSRGDVTPGGYAEVPGTARLTGTVDKPNLRAQYERPGSGIY
jgi:hypothetical protein